MADWVVVARVLHSRGIRGEVLAEGMSSDPERYAKLRDVTLVWPDGRTRPMTVDDAWEHRGAWVLHFAGIDDRDIAGELRGAEVCIPRSERPELEAGEYYFSDLVGCAMVDGETNAAIGVITGWQEYGGPALLKVERADNGQELLVPFANEICVAIQPADRVVRVKLPEGLLDV